MLPLPEGQKPSSPPPTLPYGDPLPLPLRRPDAESGRRVLHLVDLYADRPLPSSILSDPELNEPIFQKELCPPVHIIEELLPDKVSSAAGRLKSIQLLREETGPPFTTPKEENDKGKKGE